ncbi:MAG TPA: carboxy terminal-processing peptidase [Noviherbaspirillum sp.]|nr:carboxy terminal-processing peptidase [Noviherbaspirillum sp.]
MKWKLLPVVLAFVAATTASAFESIEQKRLEPSQRQVQTMQLATSILTRFPYRAIPFNPVTSERIFEHYLKSLDPEKLIFTQADIDRFADAKRNLTAEIERGELQLAFDVFNAYARRSAERLGYARELLKGGFDFTQDETFQFDRSRSPFAKTDEEVRELWRKRVKNDWLQLKLAGKETPEIRATLDKRYAKFAARIGKYKSEDVFQVFMDAIATSVDPHTDYFAPADSENFDIAMKLSLFGIGAVLQDKDEYTTVREIVPGGPAFLSNHLRPGDRIVGVGQGNDGPLIDVVGMRLDEVVDLIRGPKDSIVRLNVLPADAGPDGKQELVTLVRSKISLEQQAASKSVITVTRGGVSRQVGVISLPTFYQDFDARRKGEKDFKSATRDVIRLLTELKNDKVDAVLIDLRNNGGGSLEEAVALAGLFIGPGPVVQERNAQGQVRVDTSTLPQPLWDGAMGVLINRGSASASEIFAAAIQDYGRGVIIGEPSFGKGTVQTVIDLDKIAQNEKPELGEIKMTIAQFFRVNGGTTQLQGVTPDINFPPISDLERFGESAYDNALPSARVKPAPYVRIGDLASRTPLLKRRHEARIAQDKDFQYLLGDIAELRAKRKTGGITLNEAERIKEREIQQARIKSRENSDVTRASAPNPANSVQAREAQMRAGLGGNEGSKDEKDVWLNEAAQIITDEVELLGNMTKYAAGTRSDVSQAVE